MTDNAPERIWTNGVWVYGEHSGFGGTEYIRADRYTAVCAERDEAKREQEGWQAAAIKLMEKLTTSDELGRAFEEDAGQQRTRAEAAEAEVERLREALHQIESISPMWEGGVRGPSRDNLLSTLENVKEEARLALKEKPHE